MYLRSWDALNWETFSALTFLSNVKSIALQIERHVSLQKK